MKITAERPSTSFFGNDGISQAVKRSAPFLSQPPAGVVVLTLAVRRGGRSLAPLR
jgi:hypothetical protein